MPSFDVWKVVKNIVNGEVLGLMVFSVFLVETHVFTESVLDYVV